MPGGVHTRGVVEDQRQVPGAELAVHLRPGNVREGDRGFPQLRPVRNDDDLLAPEHLGHQLDEQVDGTRRYKDGKAELLVADVAGDQGVAAFGDAADLELPVETSGGAEVGVFQVHVRTRQGFSGFGVAHPALQHGRGQGGMGEQQQGERDEDPLHETPPQTIDTGYSFSFRSRSAFPITETELNVMAALAIMGLSRIPTKG